MQSVFANDYYEIEQDAPRKLVVMRRTSLGVPPAAGASILQDILSVLRPLRGQRLLIDVRRAPGNNDPTVEQRIQQFRRQLSELFPVSANLVATAVGRLQLSRLGRERGDLVSSIFFDEAEAIAHLMARPL
jgi:hypothetical protein